jgi:hypothetical protein
MFSSHPLAPFGLIPQPLLPGEKGRKKKQNKQLSPSPLGEGFRERQKKWKRAKTAEIMN